MGARSSQNVAFRVYHFGARRIAIELVDLGAQLQSRENRIES